MEYFVVCRQKGEGCDYTIGCGIKFLTIDAKDEQDIYNQLNEMYNGENELDLIHYVENSKVKTIDMYECKNKKPCKHKKVYAQFYYPTNPPQYPWICSECGESGVDRRGGTTHYDEYELLKKKFSK